MNNKNKKTTKIIVFSLLMTLSIIWSELNNNVVAASATGTLQVSAAVANKCTLTEINNLNFGPYEHNNNAPLDSNATFKIKCTKNTSATIQMNFGLNNSHATGTNRAMFNNIQSDYLNYELYTNATRTTVWSTSNVVTYTATSINPATINVYGRIPTHQNVQGGTYTDTVTLTANF